MPSSSPTSALPTDHVASSPPAYLVLQPPVVPPHMQSGVVSCYDIASIASQLEFGCSLRIQEKTRSLFSHLLPGIELVSTRIPCHVVGGYSSWSAAVHSILHFFRMNLDKQLIEIKKASCRNRTVFYKKNLKVLMANRPLPCPVSEAPSTTPPTRTAQAKTELIVARSITRSVAAVHAATRLGAFATSSTMHCSERHAHLPACGVCGFVKTVPILLTKEATTIARDNMGGQCVQCHQYKQQRQKKLCKSQQLSSIMALQTRSPSPCSAFQHTTVVDLKGLASSLVGSNFASHVFANRKKKITVRCVIVKTHIDNRRSFQRQYGDVQAGHLHDKNAHHHPNTLSLEEHGHASEILLVLMPDRTPTNPSRDFALVMKSNHSATTVSGFVRKEMNAIRSRVMCSRTGPASGVFDPLSGDKCRSFTAVTKQPTSLHVSPPTKTGGMVSVYYNHSQRLTRCNYGYRDLHMNRLSKARKKREAAACMHYKQILITEGYNFLFAQLCLHLILDRSC